MEDLLTLFDKVQQTSHLPVLAKEVVLVQNPGMQHWLNMQQANISGISMNAAFVLPAQFLWLQLRLLSGDKVPEQSPYSREVLAWRIDKLLQSDEVINNIDCQQVSNYWQTADGKDPLKRFQLAVQVADLFEQYLIYRPNWIDAWAQGKQVDDFTEASQAHQRWQAYLWLLLNQQSPYNPKTLIADAKQNIAQYQHLLPARISIFGINALAPMWIDFLTSLATVIDVHFYHLNPCYEYWGDIKTDKAKAKQRYLSQIEKWPEDAICDDSSNPLLANLGQQGREFLTLLHQAPNIEIPLFDQLIVDDSDTDIDQDSDTDSKTSKSADKANVLTHIQKDILTLVDKRQQPLTKIDDSITITSAHSALREVQGLHDYLLHQFNQDPSLTPKDVLVMCPQIEQYAPYIDSVFVRGWEDIGEAIPPLPCSIADRVSKDSEPLVAAFSELLRMPDSRFGVSQILSYLRLLPLQLRFGLNENDIELISDWLDKANIHWGLNAQHKNQMLGNDDNNEQFTWQLGLTRLIRGFAFGDEQQLYQHDLVLPWVEGSNAIILGKLMLLLEQLQRMSVDMASAKSAQQWQACLESFIEKLFVDSDNDNGLVIIGQAIESFTLYCQQANYDGDIELSVVREYLNQHFSQPDPGRQFMIGQITFCSMLPMRSIPFKVIAVLGLNDGEFPRQKQPLGFDLMAMSQAIPGDRSRRGDDRYLFLEALISARNKLYLSYQGRDIKNNNERQPSIVLRELINYLEYGYGWKFNNEAFGADNQLRQLPLQVFSLANYQLHNRYQSFDQKWLALAKTNADNLVTHADSAEAQMLEEIAEPQRNIELTQVTRFLQNPAKVFAEQRLKLFFKAEQQQLQDAEPFSVNHLSKYLLQDEFLTVELEHKTDVNERAGGRLKQQALLLGNFPDNRNTEEVISNWQATMASFSMAIMKQIAALVDKPQGESVNGQIPVAIEGNGGEQQFKLSQTLTLERGGNHCYQFTYRPARVKAKDIISLYLRHLFANSGASSEQVISIGYFLDEKKQALQVVKFDPLINAKQRLTKVLRFYQQGLCQPLLLNCDIGMTMFWQKGKFTENDFRQGQLLKLWLGDNYSTGLGDDPYLQYFWPQCPNITEHAEILSTVYKDLFSQLMVTDFDFADSVGGKDE
ncbi:exodeoxyribonuclease V subunit gamma [Thalassotalea sp. 42_200_T64]|nr:exodeoxyribonuclease V subunit gamma [Thalassotalea sp. 42_200_T64]